MNLRPLVLAPVLALLASVLVGVGTAPASADSGNEFDVYAVEVGDLRVNSGSCRSIPITLRHDIPYLDVSADVEIWRGSRYIDSEYLFDGGYGYLTDHLQHCPYSDGLGKFRAGPSDVEWASSDYSFSDEFRDSTTGSFTVLQDARVKNVKAKRKGKKITITGKSTWYSVSASRWVADPKGWKLRLQRQTKSGSWKTVKSLRSKKGGKFTVKTSRSSRASYRVVSNASTTTWSGVSKTFRK